VKPIDRVMRAYSLKHTLTEEQALRVRAELSAFIDDLMLGKPGMPEPPAGPSTPAGK
jgi:hypothetical protein